MKERERDHTKMSRENIQAGWDVIAKHLSRKYGVPVEIVLDEKEEEQHA